MFCRTFEEINEIVGNLGYKLLKEYIPQKGKTRRVIVQDKIGYKYDVTINSLMAGHLPYFVYENNPFTLENISLWLIKNNKPFELSNKSFFNKKNKYLYLHCFNCNDFFEIKWNNLLNGNSCGVCGGLQTGERHSLAHLYPKIAKEWHPTKNKKLTPYDVTSGTCKKAWWLCPKNHEYYSSIKNRKNGEGCKKCSDEQKESVIATELKKYLNKKFKHLCDEEHPMFKSPRGGTLHCDIYIGEQNSINGVYIEVHGEQHYKLCYFHKEHAKRNKTSPEEEFAYCKKLDKLKKKYAQKNGYYIEIDLRKITTVEDAIEYTEKMLETPK